MKRPENERRNRHLILRPMPSVAAVLAVALFSSNSAGAPRLLFHDPPKPLATMARTADWGPFLGPNHDLTSPETHLLKKFDGGRLRLVWELDKGTGYSSVSVKGDRLVLFHRIGNEEVVECVHRETGAEYWSYRYPSGYEDRYNFNNGPRSSPVIDGNLAFTHGAEGKLHAFDLETGKVLWKRDTSKEYGIKSTYFGVGSTPMVEGRLLIVQVGAPVGGPCVVAYDKQTGAHVWKAGDRWQASYASPVPATIQGNRRILVFAGGDVDPPTGGLLVIDPASGAIASRFSFRSKKYTSVNAANPTVIGDSVFLSTSYGTGCVLIDLAKPSDDPLVWKSKALQSHFATAIHVDGHLYGFDGSGKFGTGIACVDSTAGRQVWRVNPDWSDPSDTDDSGKPLPAGPYRGSMLYADGHFLILGEEGHLAWADLSPAGYNELSRVRLFRASETWTPPVVSHGLLYVCQNKTDQRTRKKSRLLCYDLRKPPTKQSVE